MKFLFATLVSSIDEEIMDSFCIFMADHYGLAIVNVAGTTIMCTETPITVSWVAPAAHNVVSKIIYLHVDVCVNISICIHKYVHIYIYIYIHTNAHK